MDPPSDSPRGRVSGPSDPASAALSAGGEGGVAYREVDVLEVKEVLRRWFARMDKKAIARELGLCARTVRRYLCWAEEAGAVRPALSSEGAAPAVDDSALDALAVEGERGR